MTLQNDLLMQLQRLTETKLTHIHTKTPLAKTILALGPSEVFNYFCWQAVSNQANIIHLGCCYEGRRRVQDKMAHANGCRDQGWKIQEALGYLQNCEH